MDLAMPDDIAPRHDGAPSWLRLPEPPAPAPEVADLLAASEAKLGYLRNGQRVQAHWPALLLSLEAVSQTLKAEGNALPARERELLALVVSVENRCEPCVFSHAAQLRQITGDPILVGTIEVNWRRAALSPREAALAAYAEKLTRRPGEVEPRDLDALRAAGLGERAILEAAAVVAYFNLSNRFNSGLGVEANPEAYLAHRAKSG